MRIWQGLALAALVIPAAAAQQVFEGSAEAGDIRAVRVHNVSGSVDFSPSEGPEVSFFASAEKDVETVLLQRDGSTMEVIVKLPSGSRRKTKTRLEVKAPPGIPFEIETVSADVTVEGVTSDAKISTVSGNVSLEGVCPVARIETVSGDVKVEGRAGSFEADTTSGNITLNAGGGDAEFETVSGDIRVTAEREKISASSTSGNVVVDSSAAELKVETISGDVQASTIRTEVSVSSTSGNITLAGGKLEKLETRTISGDTIYRGEIAPEGEFRFEAKSGNVVAEFPIGTAAEVEVRSFGGNVRAKEVAGNRRGETHEFQWGGGDAEIHIETFSGDIAISNEL